MSIVAYYFNHLLKTALLCVTIIILSGCGKNNEDGVGDLATGAFGNRAFWFYKPPGDESLREWIIDQHSLFILTHGDEEYAAQVRNSGSDKRIWRYLRADAIQDPCAGSCPCEETPLRNQAALGSNEVCRLKEQHPDWFLYHENGLIAELYEPDIGKLLYMDPASGGWQDYFAKNVQKINSEYPGVWDGVFLDNVSANIRTVQVSALRDYPDTTQWQQAVSDFLRNTQRNLSDPLAANIIGTETNAEDGWFLYDQFINTAMLEAFATNYLGVCYNAEEWMDIYNRTSFMNASNVQMMQVAQGLENNEQRYIFALISFLLTADADDVFRYADSNQYNIYFAVNDTDPGMGQPQAATVIDGNLLSREFTFGEILMDLDSMTATVVYTDNARATINARCS